MSDPRRLLDGSADEFERAMLEAGKADGPPARSVRTTAIALGLGATTLGAAGSAAATTTAATATMAVIKWVGLGVLAATIAGGVAVEVVRSRAPLVAVSSPQVSPSAIAAIAPPPAPDTAAAVMPPAASTPVVSPRIVPTREPHPAAARVPPPATPPADTPAPARAGARLAAETAALDDARTALREGHPASALHDLDVYTSAFPDGVLGQEASVLRIEALVRAGNRASARRLAQTFFRAFPGSPLTSQVRALVPEESNP